MIKSKVTLQVFLVLIITFSFSSLSFANNLNISNVSLEGRSPSNDTVVVQFDLSWENSWRTKINHDAIWVTVRLYDPSTTPTNKKLCKLVQAGLNPQGTSVGSSSDIEVKVSSDVNGAFIRPSAYGMKSSISSEDIQVTVDYSTCGFSSTSNVRASVVGIEMVYVPEGAFRAGDQDAGYASLHEGSSDSDPWYLSSESAISVTNSSSNGYRYVSAANATEDATGASFSISADYPKGYGAFYAMKYEVTEGQWVEFINSLPSSAARSNRDLTDASHKNTDTVQFRNTISCSGSPLSCSTARENRALSYISWTDLVAFLDWAAIRPMTELEFEKVARGPLLSFPGEFSWGTTNITSALAISAGSEDGSETITTVGANAHFNNVTLSGGDTGSGADYAQGPLRGGIFATTSSSRETAGAGYYGVMELSGNLSERTVTIGNAAGRAFEGTHGDGYLSTASGYEGNAPNSDWPGIDATLSNGVTSASGSGFRGGSWLDQSSAARLRISDRLDAANAPNGSFNNVGGRGVRTDD